MTVLRNAAALLFALCGCFGVIGVLRKSDPVLGLAAILAGVAGLLLALGVAPG